nr:SOS response-associated peptidase [Paenibacillus sp. LK1]
MLRWGLVPVWAKEDKIGNKMINARAETLNEKPAFKPLISFKRCIIPSSGFYEWKKEGSAKQPIRILMKDDSIFSLAGLYDTWADPDGNKLSTCTIITTEPNSLMEDIHNRMPVILRTEDEAEWLGRNNDDVQSLLGLLNPYQSSEMRAYEVPNEVGNVRNNNEDLIREVV